MKLQRKHLLETTLLNFSAPNIKKLIAERDWANLALYDKIGAIYDFVRDEILFGYNYDDATPASQVLKDGYGQCNTKAVLLMALFRAVDIPCRLHGFTIEKKLQRGVVPELIYPITPDNILHSWVEIYYKEKWVNLEGFILDKPYLRALQIKFKSSDSLCAYGAGTNTLSAPEIEWRGRDTYIQNTGINHDYGIFDAPDDFFGRHQQPLSFAKRWMYQIFIRHWMNARVRNIRRKGEA